jgi:hypothetical protein
LARFRDTVGTLELVDVRTSTALRAQLEAEGFNLDLGMVLEDQGNRYGGAEAIHRISLLSTPIDAFNRINRMIMGSRALSYSLYPLLRAGRAVTLFAMGRSRISEQPLPDSYLVFAHAWGIYTFLQLLYPRYYDMSAPMGATAWLMGLLGAYLIARPASPRIFAACISASMFDALQQMPTHSNHMILWDFTLLGMVVAAVWALARGRPWNDWFAAFVPVGRALLGVMYIFGVFHKINADYFNPAVSCAVDLWRNSPLMPQFLESLKFAAIYGTLIIEGLILAGLVSHRFRHISIIAGIAFHSLIALSDYAFYTPFSALTVALHILYLGPEAARSITRSEFWTRLHSRAGAWGTAAWCSLVALFVHLGTVSVVGVLWLSWALWLIRRLWMREAASSGSVIARPFLLNIVPLLFVLNCLTPYVGLKTAQSMNMFANLVSEGGATNHLILRHRPVGYLADVVWPIASSDPYIQSAVRSGHSLVYYDLLDHVERNRGAVVDFQRNGKIFRNQGYATLKSDIDRTLHPRWIRMWFIFRPVDTRRPKQCSIAG